MPRMSRREEVMPSVILTQSTPTTAYRTERKPSICISRACPPPRVNAGRGSRPSRRISASPGVRSSALSPIWSGTAIFYHFGLLCIVAALVQVFGPWKKRSGKMKGSLLLASIGIYAAALLLGAIGFAMSDSLSNVVNTYQFGKNLIGVYADYALKEFGGMSKSNLYLMFGCAIAFICEAFGLILVNFRICRKAESFFRLFVIDAVLIIISFLVVLISTDKYLVAGILVPTLIVTTVILTRYFSFSHTVQKYFDYD